MTEAFISLVSVTLLLLGSPGPATMALAAIGASHGFRDGMSFLLGILCGLSVAIVGAMVGLAALFEAHPKARAVCQALGAIYMVYVAYKIATAPVGRVSQDTNLPSFKDGFILNLLNPKAYAAFLAINSQFLLPLQEPALAFALTGAVCFLVATTVDAVWLGIGSVLRPLFNTPKAARAVRVSFSVLMVTAVVMALSH